MPVSPETWVHPISPLSLAWQAWQEADAGEAFASSTRFNAFQLEVLKSVVDPIARKDRARSLIYGMVEPASRTSPSRAVLYRFISEMFEHQLVEKWLSNPPSKPLEAYLITCLKNSLNQAMEQGDLIPGTGSRRHTAESRIRQILSEPEYQTVEPTPEPWKAPAAWKPPITCFQDSCVDLARRVPTYLRLGGEVTMVGCRDTINDTFDVSRSAHNRPQFMDVLLSQGVFHVEFSSLTSTGELEPRTPDGLARSVTNDVNEAVLDEGDVGEVVVVQLSRLAHEHRNLLADFVRLYELQEDGKYPTADAIHQQLAHPYKRSPRTLDERFRKHIWPFVATLAAELNQPGQIVWQAIRSLPPETIQGAGSAI